MHVTKSSVHEDASSSALKDIGFYWRNSDGEVIFGLWETQKFNFITLVGGELV